MNRSNFPRISARRKPIEGTVAGVERAKSVLMRTKVETDRSSSSKETPPNEYAQQRAEYAAEDVSLAAKRFAVNQGIKLAHRGREVLRDETERFERTEDTPSPQSESEVPYETPKTQERQVEAAQTYRHNERPPARSSQTVSQTPHHSEDVQGFIRRPKTDTNTVPYHAPQRQAMVRERKPTPRTAIGSPLPHDSPADRGCERAKATSRDRLAFERKQPHEQPVISNDLRETVEIQSTERSTVEQGRKLAQERARNKFDANARIEAARFDAPHSREGNPEKQLSRIEYQRTSAYIKNSVATHPQKIGIASRNAHERTTWRGAEKAVNGAKPVGSTPKATAGMENAVGKGAQPALQQTKLSATFAQKKMIASRKVAKQAESAVSKTSKVAASSLKALLSATQELIVSGAAGGWIAIVTVVVVVLVGAFIASPFGILFANEPTPGAMPLNVAVGQLNMELSNTLEALQDDNYDGIDIQGTGPDWREVVAVFASKTAGASDGVDVAALVPDRVDRLRTVFWDMCSIASEVEAIEHPDSSPDDDTDDSWTEYILHITITPKTADDMRIDYTFSDYQNEALTELLIELEPMELLLTDLSVSQEQARELLANLPEDLAPERRVVIEAACRLVGKVSYFWGGKSLVLGWDSRWGSIQRVWADGNSTTGTYRPYGLDCSGFVDWAFYNATGGSYVIGHGGGATMQHSYCTPISWADAIPGDLVFYPEDSHVGIVGGRDADGNLLIVHCASSYNCVVVTEINGFTTIGRPVFYDE